MVTSALLTDLIAPMVGCVLSATMYMSSLPAVYAATKRKSLGPLNHHPYPAMLAVSMGMSAYSFMINDQWLAWANLPGVASSLYYVLHSIVLLPPAADRAHLINTVLAVILFWFAVFYVTITLVGADMDLLQSVVGICCQPFVCMLYIAPLTTVKRVLASRSSESLYLPLCVINLVNSSMWLVYGWLNLNDPLVYGPNLLGVPLSFLQCALCAAFPRKSVTVDGDEEAQKTASLAPSVLKTGSSVLSLQYGSNTPVVSSVHVAVVSPVSTQPSTPEPLSPPCTSQEP